MAPPTKQVSVKAARFDSEIPSLRFMFLFFPLLAFRLLLSVSLACSSAFWIRLGEVRALVLRRV